ncbi:helix-turn-helix domain-containing protein [Chryseobacterium sp. OSA05B]|uniref:helix-turn-helix domain-containing protein n=1 Tax=Chryseobacterium sp. OSA05B TaxID=2862650 RepID=UPI001CBB0269|nr:helix-turn-helix domain-containing protein [Chryseobacterium sp. OSA05B]
MKKTNPDYKRIYEDIITYKYPEKRPLCVSILSKDFFSVKDVIKINDIIFPQSKDAHGHSENQKHRSYDKFAVMEILDYQRKNKLNNTQLAAHFSLSRNTVAKWKKHFLKSRTA